MYPPGNRARISRRLKRASFPARPNQNLSARKRVVGKKFELGDAGGEPFLNEPAVNNLNFAILHSVHHRGQLSPYLYLRPMDAKVPSIYVESGDERYVPGQPSG